MATLAVIPSDPGVSANHLDKILHAVEYLMFAGFLIESGVASRWSRGRIVLVSLAVPIVFGAALEGVQAFLPYRHAELPDVLANAAGASIGAVLGLWYPVALPMDPR